MNTYLYSKYINALRNYNGTPFNEVLLMTSQHDLDVYFSPFEHVNYKAKIVLVGISPGATQAHNANQKACELINEDVAPELVSELAKNTGAFSGPLRHNLVAMLDHIGIQEKLGVDSCDSLFKENQNLLHSTSVFRYPILLKGKPISSAKKALIHPILKAMVDTYLKEEVMSLPNSAFYIPLGQGVDNVLLYLCDMGLIPRKQILIGLPHPSGANGERISYFLNKKNRGDLSEKTNPDKIDQAKQNLLVQLSVA